MCVCVANGCHIDDDDDDDDDMSVFICGVVCHKTCCSR